MSTVSDLFSQLLQKLSDDELIEAGPDVDAFLATWQANPTDLVKLNLAFVKLSAAVQADQVSVASDVVTTGLSTARTALAAAITAAKARAAAVFAQAGTLSQAGSSAAVTR